MGKIKCGVCGYTAEIEWLREDREIDCCSSKQEESPEEVARQIGIELTSPVPAEEEEEQRQEIKKLYRKLDQALAKNPQADLGRDAWVLVPRQMQNNN